MHILHSLTSTVFAENNQLPIQIHDNCVSVLFADNTHELCLCKSSCSGLGFSVIGGRGWHTDPIRCITRVRNIFPIGPAAESGGRLRPGDVILCVNGHVTKHLSNAVSIRIGIKIHIFCHKVVANYHVLNVQIYTLAVLDTTKCSKG